MVTVVGFVRDDDVVLEMDAHEVASRLDALGQFVILPAWGDTSRWMVVAEGDDGGIAEDGLLDDDAHVNARLGDAALAYAHGLDEFAVLVHQYDVGFLGLQVLHLGQHVAVDSGGRREVGDDVGMCRLAAPAQFDSSHNLAGGVGAYALDGFQFVEVCLAEFAQGSGDGSLIRLNSLPFYYLGMSPLQPWPKSQCSSYTNSKYGRENSCSSNSVNSSCMGSAHLPTRTMNLSMVHAT